MGDVGVGVGEGDSVLSRCDSGEAHEVNTCSIQSRFVGVASFLSLKSIMFLLGGCTVTRTWQWGSDLRIGKDCV